MGLTVSGDLIDAGDLVVMPGNVDASCPRQ